MKLLREPPRTSTIQFYTIFENSEISFHHRSLDSERQSLSNLIVLYLGIEPLQELQGCIGSSRLNHHSRRELWQILWRPRQRCGSLKILGGSCGIMKLE